MVTGSQELDSTVASVDAYGRRTVLAPDGTTTRAASLYGNQKSFTGQYEDVESGLVYGRSRMYHTTLGRWIGRDRLDYVDGLNLYAA